MGKARKNLGLGLVLAALLFLFNPTASVIDPLPDFIGYLLICIGITQLADLNYHFAESLQYFKKMLVASVIQFFSIFVLFGLVTGKERPTAFLLLSFILATVEIIFLLRAYREFFEGFIYLGSRMEASAVFSVPESAIYRYEEKCKREAQRSETGKRLLRTKIESPRNVTVATARFTTIFVIIRAVLTVLPEFSALTLSAYDDTSRFNFLYDYIGMFRTLSIFIVLIIGIVWLVKTMRYVRLVLKDRPFMDALTDKYVAEVEPKTYIFIQRATKIAFAVLSVGIFFCSDIYMESNTINILPDTICALLILASLLLLRKFVKIPFYSFTLPSLYAAFSVVTFTTSASFFDKYTLTLTDIRLEAFTAFQQLKVVEIADSILFFGMMISILPVLSSVIRQYTGFSPSGNGNVNLDDKIRYVHDTLRKRLIIMAILSAVCLASGICYILLLKSVSFMWIADFITCITLSVYTLLTLNAIAQEIEYKYLLA